MAFTRLPAALAVGPVAALLLLSTAPAGAQDRCSGTLCDLYYDHVSPPQSGQPAQPAPRPSAAANAPRPLVAPNDSLLGRLFSGGAPAQPADGSPAPAKRPMVAVQGGGVIGMMQGAPQQRCTGTICDFVYGGPPPEAPEAQPAAAPAALAPARADRDVAVDDAPEAPPTREVKHCVSRTGDPWGCYRR